MPRRPQGGVCEFGATGLQVLVAVRRKTLRGWMDWGSAERWDPKPCTPHPSHPAAPSQGAPVSSLSGADVGLWVPSWDSVEGSPSPLLTLEALLGVLRQPHGDGEADAGGAAGDKDGAGRGGGHGCAALRSKGSYEIRTRCHVGAGSASPEDSPGEDTKVPKATAPSRAHQHRPQQPLGSPPPPDRTRGMGTGDGTRGRQPHSRLPTLGPSGTCFGGAWGSWGRVAVGWGGGCVVPKSPPVGQWLGLGGRGRPQGLVTAETMVNICWEMENLGGERSCDSGDEAMG